MPIKKNTTVWGNPKRTVRRQLSLAVVNSSIPEKTKTVNGMDGERDEVFPACAEASAISPCTSAAFWSLPRARGGVSPRLRTSPRATTSSPRTRRRLYTSSANILMYQVFPAHAEASLLKPYEDVSAASLLRAQEDKFPPHAEAPRAVISAQTSRTRPFAQKQRRRAFRIIPDFTVKRKTGASRASLAPGGCGTRIRT